MSTVKKILVTGGAGYIGSHTAKLLRNLGYSVTVLDNLSTGHSNFVPDRRTLIVGDLADKALLKSVFSNHQFDAVVHFAASAYVGESIYDPAKYYQNNVACTLNLLEAMIQAKVKKLVFSSTCAIYGEPIESLITENHPKNPINPYGMSKLVVERILQDFDSAYGLKSVALRYFNAAGADPDGEIGEDHEPETHLIPNLLLTALGKKAAFYLQGTDYPTPDGTCVRDFIHVCDLAEAHVLALDYLFNEGISNSFNLANGTGYSIKQMISCVEKITQRRVNVIEVERRKGDPSILISSSKKASIELAWRPKYTDLATIVTHAWKWHQKRHGSLEYSEAI